MKNIFIILLAIPLFLSSCKKEELSFTLKGTVNDETLNSSISSAKVSIYTFPLGSTLGTKVTTLTTDSQGNFEYELVREKYEKIEIKVEKENYFTNIDVIPFSNLSTENENTFSYSLNAKSWTRFVIYNQQPLQSDELKIFKDSGKEDCDECCANGYSYYYGAADTSVYCPNNGNEYMKFYYWVNGNESNGLDSVYNTPFDTVTYEFYY